MERKELNGSQIEWIEYNKTLKELDVCFVKGGVYRYSGVPMSVYEAFDGGKYFHANVKGKYEFVKLN